MTAVQSGVDGTIDVTFRDNIALVTLNRGDNRFNDDFLFKFNAALDEVLRHPGVKAMITTGTGKFYSNGLDLTWLGSMGRRNIDKADRFAALTAWKTCILRILTFPLPTIALVNGHAFAGGAMLALSHDHVIMQNTRGWWCVNEVHLNMTFPPVPYELLMSKLPNGQTKTEAMIYGYRFTGSEAASAGIAHETCAPEEMYSRALNWVKKVVPVNGYNREHLQVMKQDIHKNIISSSEKKFELTTSKL